MKVTDSFATLLREPQSGLHYRRISATGEPRARLLLLHGVGGNETNLAGLAAHLPKDLELLFLQAPLPIAGQGYAWFQVRFTNSGPLIDAPQANTSRLQLLRFIQGLPALPTVIGGFSQGGILSASVGLSAPHLVAGFAVLSGRILPELEEHLAAPEALATLSAFIAHGHHDDKLPPSWAERADTWLQNLQVPHVTHYYDMGHEIVAAEVADFSAWLRTTLPLE